jgi:hypothetical protein
MVRGIVDLEGFMTNTHSYNLLQPWSVIRLHARTTCSKDIEFFKLFLSMAAAKILMGRPRLAIMAPQKMEQRTHTI